ncbi:hypothetical protein, partial [Sphingobium yanoikuyae]|uniref:hypothetical protein n=1 Tax=Sphingobium yanoikuyae TaxID=13690 RepID=UPI001BE47D17
CHCPSGLADAALIVAPTDWEMSVTRPSWSYGSRLPALLSRTTAMTWSGTVLPFQIDRSDGSSCLEPTYIVCLTGITDRQKVGRLLTVLFWGEIG